MAEQLAEDFRTMGMIHTIAISGKIATTLLAQIKIGAVSVFHNNQTQLRLLQSLANACVRAPMDNPARPAQPLPPQYFLLPAPLLSLMPTPPRFVPGQLP